MRNPAIAGEPGRAIRRDQAVHYVVPDNAFHFVHFLRARAVVTVQSRLRPNPQKALAVLGHGGHGNRIQTKLLVQPLHRVSRMIGKR
jgi:hypothetical protein